MRYNAKTYVKYVPVYVDAIQYTDENKEDVINFIDEIDLSNSMKNRILSILTPGNYVVYNENDYTFEIMNAVEFNNIFKEVYEL